MSEPWDFGDAAEHSDAAFPWPPGEGDPLLGRFGETWRSATFDPTSFFRRVPRQRGSGAAVLYYLVIVLLVACATLFWDSLAFFSGGRGELAAELGIQPVNPIVGFLLTPAVLLVMLFVAAAVTHMILSLFDGVQHGFGTTVRVFAYAYSPGLFGVVPWVGGLVGSIWMIVLLIIGLREAHETDGWKTAVAVLLPFFLLMGLMILAFMMVMAAGAALMGTG
jgi:hypothetical protein